MPGPSALHPVRQSGMTATHLLSLCVASLVSLPAAGQNAGPLQSLNAVKKEALHNDASFQFLQELSDRIGPRLTGSPQEAQAGDWALRTMRAIGLQNVHAEPWQLEKGWRRHYARCRLISPFPLELIVASYGWAGSTPKRDMVADVVQVDADALPAEARNHAASWSGKVLHVSSPDPRHSDAMRTLSQLPEFLAAAADAGAVAVILRDRRPGAALPHTGPLGFPGRSASIAVLDPRRRTGGIHHRAC